jgi:hypothetical protein
MSSVQYAHLDCRTETDLAFSADFKPGPLNSTPEIPYLASPNLTDFLLPLKELVQAMARQAAEMDFKN